MHYTLGPLQLILPNYQKCWQLALSDIYIHYQFTICVITVSVLKYYVYTVPLGICMYIMSIIS